MPGGGKIRFSQRQGYHILHLAGDIEETPDTRRLEIHQGGIEELFVLDILIVHLITGLLSYPFPRWGTSRRYPLQQYEYNARGQITGVVDGNQNPISYDVDSWGRITGIGFVDGGKELSLIHIFVLVPLFHPVCILRWQRMVLHAGGGR